MTMKIRINIDVPDLVSATAFYQEALGLQINRFLDDDTAELVGASSLIYLLAKPTGSSSAGDKGEPRRYMRHWTPVHLDFEVDDLEEATARVLKAGAVQESDCIKWMGSSCITFSDPFGHGFCLIHFAGTTYSPGPHHPS
jgi:predicted enzyme related to lactoylglutathione lyase